MMSKFKQLRLRLVVAVAVLLMAGTGTEAFAQCYTKTVSYTHLTLPTNREV